MKEHFPISLEIDRNEWRFLMDAIEEYDKRTEGGREESLAVLNRFEVARFGEVSTTQKFLDYRRRNQ